MAEREELLTMAQAAARAGRSERTIGNWRLRGLLGVVRVGVRDVRIRSRDLERLLQGTRVERAPRVLTPPAVEA